MKPDLKFNFRKRKKKLTSLLGLMLDGSRLDGVVLKRNNGALQQLQNFSVQLTLDPLTAPPELVGREIRNQLDAVGVRERDCIVGLPLRWALTAQTELPPLPEADALSLLQLEAEKNFHTDVSQLQLANSRSALAGEKQYVLIAGMPNTHIGSLENILAAAKLSPVSFAIGISALQPPGKADGVLALVIGENNVSLQVASVGGVAALRALEGAVENEGGRRTLHADVVAREARITLGQLPVKLRETMKHIRIFGPRELTQQLADEMELRFEPAGLKTEIVPAYAPNEFGAMLPPDASLSAAFSLAANFLMERAPAFEFLPPKPTVIEQLVAKYSSGRLRTTGAIAAGVAIIIISFFLFQQIQLWRLRSQWSHISKTVTELQNIQDQIRFYRPWYDDSYRGLAILRQLTLAFPEDGSVTAKTIDIRDGSAVSCSGNARDIAALLAMQAKLRTVPGVTELHLSQQRGKSPMQFSFEFKYSNGGSQ